MLEKNIKVYIYIKLFEAVVFSAKTIGKQHLFMFFRYFELFP